MTIMRQINDTMLSAIKEERVEWKVVLLLSYSLCSDHCTRSIATADSAGCLVHCAVIDSIQQTSCISTSSQANQTLLQAYLGKAVNRAA